MSSKALFDDNNDSSSAEEVDASERLKVNKRFAKNYQSRKQLEELRNHHESDDDSSSDDESEDEDGNLLTPSMDVSILKTINALRKKDNSIYNPDTKFFTEETAAAAKTPSKTTKKHFKDVLREQILEQIDDEENGKNKANSRKSQQKETTDRLAYDEEQKKLRSAFLVNDSDDDDDDDKHNSEGDDDNMLVVKKKAEPLVTDHELEKEYEALQQTNGSVPLKDPRGEVQDGDGFLIDFLKNKKWLDRDDDVEDDDEEEEAERRRRMMNNNSDDDSIDDVDRADDFESKYNFRFEEAQSEVKSGADFSIMGYARSGTMDTLRRKDDSRRQARLERKERKAAERKAKEEQLRRLKNAKREEMDSKLREIKKVLGAASKDTDNSGGAAGPIMDEDAMMKLMEGDYDPEKFEKIMQEAYGDDFYEKEDTQWKSDKDVRESLLQDEDGNVLVGEDDADGGLYDNQEEEEEQGGDDDKEEEYFGEEEEAGDYGDDELTAPAESKMERKLKSKMQEELYKLDYEDIVAGMPTRFKYRKVEPNNYGLSTKEILLARDTTLKNFVSLKKMAPYRDVEEAEHTVGYKKRRRFRDILKEDLAEQAAAEGIGEKKQPSTTVPDDGDEEQDGDGKTKKRRRQKKGKKKEDDSEPKKVETVVEDIEESTEPTKDTVETAGGKKRRRKKKGKKVSKTSEDVSEDVSANDKVDTPLEKEKSDAANEKGKQDEKKSKKKRRKTMDRDDPTRKKKKRSKKDKIAGVPDSRLEAYGL